MFGILSTPRGKTGLAIDKCELLMDAMFSWHGLCHYCHASLSLSWLCHTVTPPGDYGAVTHPWPLITAMSSTLLWLLSVSCLKLTSVCLYTGFLLWVDTRGSRSENYLYLKEQKDFPLSQDPRSTHLFCVCPWATITISQFPALRARQHGSRLKMWNLKTTIAFKRGKCHWQLTECCLIRDNHCNQITVFVVVEEASENADGEH